MTGSYILKVGGCNDWFMLNVIFVCVEPNSGMTCPRTFRELKILLAVRKDWLMLYLMYTNCMFNVISYYSIYLI